MNPSKNVLIIGHNGLIGSCLYSCLIKNNLRVDIIEEKINSASIINITNKMRDTSYDAIFNCAWPLINKYLSVEANIQATEFIYNLKEIVKSLKSFKRLYLIGSCLEFGYSDNLNRILDDSTSFAEPYDQFTFSKYLSRRVFSSYKGKIFYAIPFYVYSELSKKGLFKYLKNNIDNDKVIEINSSKNFVDWIHAEDVANGIAMHYLKQCQETKFNITSNLVISIEELIRKASKGGESQFKFNQISKENSFLGNSNILTQLGWKPRYNVLDWLSNYLRNEK